MSSTTQKHDEFVSEPMGHKPVTALPAIGSVLGERLDDAGLDKAKDILGQSLVMKQNEETFKGWLKDTCNANAKQADDCTKGLNEWCKGHM